MSAWARAVATTIRRYTKIMEDATVRNRELLNKISQGGRIQTNCSGLDFQWEVEFQTHDTEVNTGENQITFARKNRWKNAVLPHDRGLLATDAIYELEKLQNRGNEALVKVYEKLMDRLMKDCEQALARQLYLDGNASGNEHAIHGLESAFGTVTQTIDSTTTGATARTANVADWLYYHAATYAGISTIVGSNGAYRSASGTWPDGEADQSFDYWSPLIVNYNSSKFGGSANSWEEHCVEAIRWSILQTARNNAGTGSLNMFLLDRKLLYELMNRQDAKEQIIVTGATKSDKMGFVNGKNARMYLDGVEITTDYGIPALTGYGFNTDQFELLSMKDVLFDPFGPDFDIESQADRFVVRYLGNMKMKDIRQLVKLYPGISS